MVLRLQTFLFADLVGFTELTSLRGDDEAAELAISFHGYVSELARGILGLARAGGLPPVRVGLDTGPAVERDGDWFGATVNTASRVTAAAGTGELLMTERTRNAAAGVGGLELTARGQHRLKGLPEQALFGEPPRSRG